MKQKCVFLDRDGVINKERGTYTYLPDDFDLLAGVPEALAIFHRNGFKNIVITNQSGISQGIYTKADMELCHQKMLQLTSGGIDDIFYCRWHPKISESLMRKPDSLMLERAIALHDVDVKNSWMIGDKERDLIPAKKLGLKTVLIADSPSLSVADHVALDLLDAAKHMLP